LVEESKIGNSDDYGLSFNAYPDMHIKKSSSQKKNLSVEQSNSSPMLLTTAMTPILTGET